jgi:F-type H+-transporting ATPase subunit a
VILQSEWVALASVPFSAAIYLLEIFVSFVQAFVFTLLSTVFIGMAAHPDH